MAKKFARVAAVPKQAIVPQDVTDISQARERKIINLERIDLSDRENWLRALDLCKTTSDLSLGGLLKDIETYQGQIDQALQTAQAQSTIYAYAIGTRLDVIEQNRLFEEKNYENLTAFIKAGEVKRPNGQSITTRQVWAYRSVTRGLNEFLSLAEEIRAGKPLSPELTDQLEMLGKQINQDIVDAFLKSYSEAVTGVLELGVSKLEQVYRLPKPIALSGLLSGRLALSENVLEMRETPFSALRKAISTHEKEYKPLEKKRSKKSKQKSTESFTVDSDNKINQLDLIVKFLAQQDLTQKQLERLRRVSEALARVIKD